MFKRWLEKRQRRKAMRRFKRMFRSLSKEEQIILLKRLEQIPTEE